MFYKYYGEYFKVIGRSIPGNPSFKKNGAHKFLVFKILNLSDHCIIPWNARGLWCRDHHNKMTRKQ